MLIMYSYIFCTTGKPFTIKEIGFMHKFKDNVFNILKVYPLCDSLESLFNFDIIIVSLYIPKYVFQSGRFRRIRFQDILIMVKNEK